MFSRIARSARTASTLQAASSRDAQPGLAPLTALRISVPSSSTISSQVLPPLHATQLASLFPGPLDAPTPGVYRHYSGSLYTVFGSVLHTETGDVMTLYRSNNAQEARNPLGMAFARPAAMFADHVEHQGQKVPRFKLLQPMQHDRQIR